MFVTKKGSNLRRPTGKMRNNILVPALKKDDIVIDSTKNTCKKKVTGKRNDKEEVTE